jgi:hypothetical protein
MNKGMLSLVIGAFALTAASAASAHVDVSVGINPFGFGYFAPPPVVYQPAPVYAPPPAVYVGGGYWGGDRRRYGGRNDHRGGHR